MRNVKLTNDPGEISRYYPLALPMGTVFNGYYEIRDVLGLSGFGVKYPDAAIDWYQKAASLNFPPALGNLKRLGVQP